jgi:hypothetical protein
MHTKRLGKTKNKLPLSLRVAKYLESIGREQARYEAMNTPSGMGHAQAIRDTVAMMPGPGLTDDQITAHLLEVGPRLDEMATQQAEAYREALEKFRALDANWSSIHGEIWGEKMQYHKGAAYEYKRQCQQVRNLLNDLPED